MTGRPGSGKTESEEDLWERAVKDVRPLPGKTVKRRLPDSPVRNGKAAALPPVFPAQVIKKTEQPASKNKKDSSQSDGHTLRRLTRGQMDIDGRLDLHGHTLNTAQAALIRCVERARTEGYRCLLVITGKGEPGQNGRGAIRRELPHWLELPPLSQIVLNCRPARPEHGGSGAFYLLLRRTRT